MRTSVKGYRQQALRRRAWQSTGTTFENNCLDALNQSLTKISLDLPSAIVPHVSHQILYKQYKSADDDVSAYLEATTDDRVLRFSTRDNRALGLGDWVPTINGSWDGIMWLEIQRPDGTWERHRSMAFFKGSVGTGDFDDYYVTIDRPWRNTTDDEMEFRIWQEYFYLPSDVTKLMTPIRIYNSFRYLVPGLNLQQMQDQNLYDYQGDVVGPPQYFSRAHEFEQLPATMTAPTVQMEDIPWAGDFQEGKFRFLVTRTRGTTNPIWQNSPNGNARDPVLESGVSPISAQYNQTLSANLHKSMKINFTSIEQQLNFAFVGGLSSTRRTGHSGYKTRIYVMVDYINTSGDGLMNNVDADGVPYLLAEVDGDATYYIWNGSTIPDYERRAVNSSGYYPWKIYPIPDQDYEIDLSCEQTPQELVHDYDTPCLNEKYSSMFMDLLLSIICEMDGSDLASSNEYLRRYSLAVGTTRASISNPTGMVESPMFNSMKMHRRYRPAALRYT